MPKQTSGGVPDGQEAGHHFKGGAFDDLGIILVVFVVMSLIFGALVYAKSHAEIERDRQERFMSHCIEFQTKERCWDLLRWNREDLVRPK